MLLTIFKKREVNDVTNLLQQLGDDAAKTTHTRKDFLATNATGSDCPIDTYCGYCGDIDSEIATCFIAKRRRKRTYSKNPKKFSKDKYFPSNYIENGRVVTKKFIRHESKMEKRNFLTQELLTNQGDSEFVVKVCELHGIRFQPWAYGYWATINVKFEGISLKDHLNNRQRQNKYPNIKEIREIMRGIYKAINYFHNQGVAIRMVRSRTISINEGTNHVKLTFESLSNAIRVSDIRPDHLDPEYENLENRYFKKLYFPPEYMFRNILDISKNKIFCTPNFLERLAPKVCGQNLDNWAAANILSDMILMGLKAKNGRNIFNKVFETNCFQFMCIPIEENPIHNHPNQPNQPIRYDYMFTTNTLADQFGDLHGDFTLNNERAILNKVGLNYLATFCQFLNLGKIPYWDYIYKHAQDGFTNIIQGYCDASGIKYDYIQNGGFRHLDDNLDGLKQFYIKSHPECFSVYNESTTTNITNLTILTDMINFLKEFYTYGYNEETFMIERMSSQDVLNHDLFRTNTEEQRADRIMDLRELDNFKDEQYVDEVIDRKFVVDN